MALTFGHDHDHGWHRDDRDEPRWGRRRSRRRAERAIDHPSKGRQARRTDHRRGHTFADHFGSNRGAASALVAALLEFGRAYWRESRDGDA